MVEDMEDEPLGTTIPAWKLEIIKNRARANQRPVSGSRDLSRPMRGSSASFSHYDRTVRPQTEGVKTQDMIKFFNKSTDGSTRLASSRSFSCGRHQRQGWAAARAGTTEGRELLAPGSPGSMGRYSNTIKHILIFPETPVSLILPYSITIPHIPSAEEMEASMNINSV